MADSIIDTITSGGMTTQELNGKALKTECGQCFDSQIITVREFKEATKEGYLHCPNCGSYSVKVTESKPIAEPQPTMETESQSVEPEDDQDNLPANVDDNADWMEKRLWRVAERTQLDGTTETDVVEWMPEDYGGEKPRIRFEHPLKPNETITTAFDTPKGDTEEEEFVRFLDQYELSLRSVGEIENYSIRVKHNDGSGNDWEPIIPNYEEPTPVRRKQFADKMNGGANWVLNSPIVQFLGGTAAFLSIIAFWPLTFYHTTKCIYKYEQGGSFNEAPEKAFFGLLLGTFLFIIFWVLFGLIDASTIELLFESVQGPDGMEPQWKGF